MIKDAIIAVNEESQVYVYAKNALQIQRRAHMDA